MNTTETQSPGSLKRMVGRRRESELVTIEVALALRNSNGQLPLSEYKRRMAQPLSLQLTAKDRAALKRETKSMLKLMRAFLAKDVRARICKAAEAANNQVSDAPDRAAPNRKSTL